MNKFDREHEKRQAERNSLISTLIEHPERAGELAPAIEAAALALTQDALREVPRTFDCEFCGEEGELGTELRLTITAACYESPEGQTVWLHQGQLPDARQIEMCAECRKKSKLEESLRNGG